MSDTEKTGVNTGAGQFQKGADPRRGHGVKGKGRPSNEFRENIRALIDSPKVRAAVKKILSDPDHRQFARLYATLVAQAHGNPTQPIELNPNAIPVFEVITTKKADGG